MTLEKFEEEANLMIANEKKWCDAICFLAHVQNGQVMYLGCPRCNKKVIDVGSGWRCELCNMTHETPKVRYSLRVRLSDHTSSLTVNVFDPAAEELLGRPAREMKMLRETDPEAFEAVLQERGAFREIRVRLMARRDVYNGEGLISYQAVRIYPNDTSRQGSEKLIHHLEGRPSPVHCQ
jgi:replication factor A1